MFARILCGALALLSMASAGVAVDASASSGAARDTIAQIKRLGFEEEATSKAFEGGKNAAYLDIEVK